MSFSTGTTRSHPQPNDPILLAIDDDPGRYDYLRVLLDDRSRRGLRTPRLVVATCPACVSRTLPHAAVVLLDYDLDSTDLCPNCGGYAGVSKGIEYIPTLTQARLPVIVTSCSAYENRRALVDGLDAGRVPARSVPADSLGVEYEWLGHLWFWSVL